MFGASAGFKLQSPGSSGSWPQQLDAILTVPYALNLINWKNATGFCVEYWAFIPATANLQFLASPQTDVPFGPGQWQGSTNYWSFGFSPTLQVQFYYWGSGKFSIGTAANAVTTNSWNNIATNVTMSGTTFTMRVFVNGVQQNIRANNAGAYASTYSNTNGAFGASTPFGLGAWGGGGNSVFMFIDELRVSNTSRYTTSYTPATTPFTSDASTQLLMKFTGTEGQTTFTDSSSFARTITNPNSYVKVTNYYGVF